MAFIEDADYEEWLKRKREAAASRTAPPAPDTAWQQAAQQIAAPPAPAPSLPDMNIEPTFQSPPRPMAPAPTFQPPPAPPWQLPNEEERARLFRESQAQAYPVARSVTLPPAVRPDPPSPLAILGGLWPGGTANESAPQAPPFYRGAGDLAGAAGEQLAKLDPAWLRGVLQAGDVANPLGPRFGQAWQAGGVWGSPEAKATYQQSLDKAVAAGATPFVPEGAPRMVAGATGEILHRAAENIMPTPTGMRVQPLAPTAEDYSRWATEPTNPLIEAGFSFTNPVYNVSPGEVGALGLAGIRALPRVAQSTASLAARGARAAAPAVGRAAEGAVPLGRKLLTEERGALELGRQAAAPEASPQARRFYHGTGTAFDVPNIAKGDQNALFGPGYYLTSNADVAGGLVSETYGAPELMRKGYAQNAQPMGPGSDVYNGMVRSAEARVRFGKAALQDVGLPSEARVRWERDLADAEKELRNLFSESGPNVRAIDIPQNLNLFDTTLPDVDAATIDRIASALPQGQQQSFGIQASNARWQGPRQYVNGETVYKLLADVTNSKSGANAALEKAGYDGLQYAGGRHMPLLDAQGQAIEHTAVVVFPQGLPKIRNAISGTPMGSAPEVGGAIVGGLAAPQDPNASDLENLKTRALWAAGGGLIGYGGRRLGQTSRLGGTVEDASKYLDDTAARYNAIESRLSEIEPKIEDLYARRGVAAEAGTIMRPPNAGSLSNAQIEQLAKEHGLNPYESGWYDRLDPEAIKELGPGQRSGRLQRPSQGDLAALEAEHQALTAERVRLQSQFDVGYQAAYEKPPAPATAGDVPVPAEALPGIPGSPERAAGITPETLLRPSGAPPVGESIIPPKGAQGAMFQPTEAGVRPEFARGAKPAGIASEADLLGGPQFESEAARAQWEREQAVERGQGEMFGAPAAEAAPATIPPAPQNIADAAVSTPSSTKATPYIDEITAAPDQATLKEIARRAQHEATVTHSLTTSDSIAIDRAMTARHDTLIAEAEARTAVRPMPEPAKSTVVPAEAVATVTAAQEKVLAPARKAALSGKGSLKVWRDDAGNVYVERATGGSGYSYSTVKPDGTVKSGMPEQQQTWTVLEDSKAGAAAAPPAKPPRRPPTAQGPAAPAPREPYLPKGERAPLWAGKTEAGPPLRGGEPPAPPEGPTPELPSGRGLGGPERAQPLTVPRDPYEQLVEALVPTEPTKREAIQQTSDRILRAMYDRVWDAHTLENATGIPVHKLAQVVPGSIAYGEYLVDSRIMPVLRGLGGDVSHLEEYMVARRLEDILARNPAAKLPGKIPGWAGQIRAVEGIQRRVGPERFAKIEETAGAIWKLNDELVLKPRLEAGLLSKEQYTAIKTAHPHYISFYREDFTGLQTGLGRGRGEANVTSAGIDQMDLGGSWRKLNNPLARFNAQVIATQHLIAENKAARSIVDALTEMEKAGAPKGAAREPLNTGERFVKILRPSEAAEHSKIWDTVSYLEDGKKVTAQVPAVFATMAKGLEAETANFWNRLARVASFPLRAGAVTYNIAFMPKNVLRDLNSALFREALQPLSEEYVRGWQAALTHNQDYADAARAGALMSGIVENMRTTNALGRAQLGAITVNSPKDALLVIPRLIGKAAGKIEAAGVVSEQATRIATYYKLRAQGLSELEAAVRARDVTVDFAKAGNIMKVINQAVPFSNAGLQGAANTLRTMRYNPKQAIIGASPLAALSVLAWANNQRYETANTIPEREYAMNWVFVVGEGTKAPDPRRPNAPAEKFPVYLRVPKGSIGGLLTAPVEMSLRFAAAHEDKSVLDYLGSGLGTMATSLSPVEPSISGLLPPLAETAIGASVKPGGWDAFRQQGIVPRSEQGRLPELQYGPQTSKVAIALGEQFRVSPRIIDWAIKDAGAGVASQTLWLSDLILGAVGYNPAPYGEAKMQPLTTEERLARLSGGFVGTQNRQQENIGWDAFDKAVEQSQRMLTSQPELRRLGITAGSVADTITFKNGAKVLLEPKERADLQTATTTVMIGVVRQLAAMPDYSGLKDVQKQQVMQRVMDKARENTRMAYIGRWPEDELRRRISESLPAAVGQ